METLEVFGKRWFYGMEDGRRIHPQFPNVVDTEDCVAVRKQMNGSDVLELSTRKLDEPVTTRHWDGKDYISNYATGSIYSCDSYSYGTFSIEAVLPKGSMQHAAFWMSGDSSWPPEIDCFETYNTKRGRTLTCPDIVTQIINGYASDLLKWNGILPARRVKPNLHWGTKDNHECLCAFNTPFNFFDEPYICFNTYEVVWMPELIKIEYNRNLVLECRNKDILECFNKDPHMHVILSNSYVPDVQSGVKDEMPMPKTTYVIRSFTYREL